MAYAQIAGLPPSAGLVAAPGAMVGYALVGGSRTVVVSATTATSAVSAATVGPLAGHDASRFAAPSAAFALVTALVLVGAGLPRLGAVSDVVSKPVMTGFLFGLGLTIAIGQLLILLTGLFLTPLFEHLPQAALAALVVKRLSRPQVARLARDPHSGAWGAAERHPAWRAPRGLVVGRVGGPLFYANAVNVKEQLLALVRASDPPPRAVGR